jgi:hypothetical protein
MGGFSGGKRRRRRRKCKMILRRGDVGYGLSKDGHEKS